ncbi:uncharacterized protein METZ01_LOCUS223361 [marine metagenome]|uniref:Uncharacterized protein n=1 Tax=marine metagenome TaxID=408172 RepID=A0A382G7F6_9ZZZZ
MMATCYVNVNLINMLNCTKYIRPIVVNRSPETILRGLLTEDVNEVAFA